MLLIINIVIQNRIANIIILLIGLPIGVISIVGDPFLLFLISALISDDVRNFLDHVLEIDICDLHLLLAVLLLGVVK
jgi:hypothetical protein